MKRIITFLILIMLGSQYTTLHSELLIVKKTAEGVIVPLSAEDIEQNGAKITDIIKKYSWPLCLLNVSKLSQNEQNELFTPGKPRAGEIFIQKKIKEQGGVFEQYQVAFIPTELYELFCVLHLFQTKGKKNPLQNSVNKLMLASKEEDDEDITNPYIADFGDVLDEAGTAATIRRKIAQIFNKANGLFLDSWLYVNDQLVKFLFSNSPGFNESADALALSQAIQGRSNNIATLLANDLFKLSQLGKNALRLPHVDPKDASRNDPYILLNSFQDKELSDILMKVVGLEYEARQLNKALLLRGASFKEFQAGLGDKPEERITLAGTTVFTVFKYDPEGRKVPFEKLYRKQKIAPHSLSFGNSLFAGSLRMRDAAVYHFLLGRRMFGDPHSVRSTGYALFIDKKAYVEHGINNLFFIPPLLSLASLFQEGEYFHPRAKAAVPLKKKEGQVVGAIEWGKLIKDPTGVLLITRDPLHHAELFSKFLAKNAKIIQVGDMSNLSKEEKEFAQKVSKSQIDVAKLYQAVRVLTPVIAAKVAQIRARKGIQELGEDSDIEEEFEGEFGEEVDEASADISKKLLADDLTEDQVVALLSRDVDVNFRDEETGDTPMHAAARRGNAAIVSMLIENGAKMSNKNKEGKTPRDVTASQEIVEIINANNSFLKSFKDNKDLDAIKKLVWVDGVTVFAVDELGNTALHISVENKRKDGVELLIKEAFVCAAFTNDRGETPLHLAVNNEDVDMVKLLLSLEDASYLIEDKSKSTPEILSIQLGNDEIVKILKAAEEAYEKNLEAEELEEGEDDSEGEDDDEGEEK